MPNVKKACTYLSQNDPMFILRGHGLPFPVSTKGIYYYFSKARFFVLANTAGPDEAPACAAVHLGLHCLPKCTFVGFRSTNG